MRILPFFLISLFLLIPEHPVFGQELVAEDVVPATAYFPVLPLDAPEESMPQFVPLAVNRSLGGDQKDITRAVIVIHNESRDATSALAMISALAGNQNASTIILAPQFLLPSDIVRFADYLPENGKGFAAWQVLGWSRGDESMPVAKYKSVSSFTVIDLLLMYLADRAAFPDLKDIVIAGYGAGANFTQRYAAFTAAADVIAKQNISLRYVVAAPTSYLYLTAPRPKGGKKGFGLPDAKACPTVNTYPHGLEKLNPYARRRGGNAAKIDYSTRAVTYLYGQAADSFPEINCAAQAQGYNGAARTDNYRLYLNTLYGDLASRSQTFFKTKGNKNDPLSLYGSACGVAALFGDAVCLLN